VLRTHEAGTLRADQAGQTVTLAGWVARRRDHGGVAFLDLRDASGVVQVVARDEVLDEGGGHEVRNEFCVQVTGEVRLRPEGNANPELPTGQVEVVARSLAVLNPADPLPFQIDDRVSVGEETRLRYRYLDLRRTGPGAAIRLRSRVNAAARGVLAQHDFVEIETPTMTRSTPRVRATSSCPRASPPAAGMPFRRARSCSNSCSWSPGWSATTRSPGAIGMRTSGPTGSRSSPNWTSR